MSFLGGQSSGGYWGHRVLCDALRERAACKASVVPRWSRTLDRCDRTATAPAQFPPKIHRGSRATGRDRLIGYLYGKRGDAVQSFSVRAILRAALKLPGS